MEGAKKYVHQYAVAYFPLPKEATSQFESFEKHKIIAVKAQQGIHTCLFLFVGLWS